MESARAVAREPGHLRPSKAGSIIGPPQGGCAVVRTFGIVLLLFATPLTALAQQAICDCCWCRTRCPEQAGSARVAAMAASAPTAAGSAWTAAIGRTTCGPSTGRFNGMRSRKGLTAAQISHLDRLIDRSHQRWSDLRVLVPGGQRARHRHDRPASAGTAALAGDYHSGDQAAAPRSGAAGRERLRGHVLRRGLHLRDGRSGRQEGDL